MPIVNNLSAGTGYEPHGHCTQAKDINQSPGQLSTRDQANSSRGHRLPLFQIVVFFFAQKLMIRGVVLSGIKA